MITGKLEQQCHGTQKFGCKNLQFSKTSANFCCLDYICSKVELCSWIPHPGWDGDNQPQILLFFARKFPPPWCYWTRISSV